MQIVMDEVPSERARDGEVNLSILAKFQGLASLNNGGKAKTWFGSGMKPIIGRKTKTWSIPWTGGSSKRSDNVEGFWRKLC